MFVKIINCGNENAWYYGRSFIGDVWEVVNETETHYEVRNTGSNLLIKKTDARVLSHRFED